MKSLILVDLSGIFRAAWHQSEDQELGSAFSKTVDKVRALIEGFDYSAICLDVPPYKRKELSADYKAQRDAPPPQLVEQFTRVKERLTADGLLLWGVKGYEADDIIATAVGPALAEGLDVMIASSDKDLAALIVDAPGEGMPRVRQVSLATGVVSDEGAIITKFGVPPKMMPDLLALMGDSSDNIPGIEKVGAVTAAKLLKQFGSFEDILSFPDQIKTDKLRENVIAGTAGARLARKLVTLYTDAPIKFSDLYERREPKTLSKNTGFDDAEFDVAEPEANHSEAPKSSPEQKAQQQAQDQPPAQQSNAVKLQPRPQAIVAVASVADWALQLEPASTRDAFTMATKLHDSRLFSQYGTAEAIFAVILRGRALGIDAVTSLANFHVIKGRPVMHASLIVGLVLKSGKAEYFDLVETTEEKATWATKRKGSTREVVLSWTIEDALNARLLTGTPENAKGIADSNWDKYRRTMLRWRAATELARAVYSDVTTGLYTPDEVADGVYNPEIERKHAD